MSSSELFEKFQKAAETFVFQEKTKIEVIGIVLTGSFVYGNLYPNSDIDIHIILSQECEWRERGNTFINEVEIEYFKNPPIQIRSYFKSEIESPHTAEMLTNGSIVYQNSNIVDELVAEAKAIIESKPKPLSSLEIELGKYFLDDLFKDLEDVMIKKDIISVELIKSQIIERCINIFCKSYKIRREKTKRLEQQLKAIDIDFAMKLKKSLSQDWKENGGIYFLKEYIEKLLGGSRPKEWKLKSQLVL